MKARTFPLSLAVLLSYYPISFNGLTAQGTKSVLLFTEESDAQYLLLLLENAADSKKQFWKCKEELTAKRKLLDPGFHPQFYITE